MTDTVHPSRAAAIAAQDRFYRGAPCKRGHDGVRNVGNKACRQCGIEQGITRRLIAPMTEDGDREAARRKAWKAANREAHLQSKRDYRLANADKVKAYKASKRAEMVASPEYRLKLRRIAERAAISAAHKTLARWAREAEKARLAPMRALRTKEAQARLAHRGRLKAKARRALKRGGADAGIATHAQIDMIHALQGGRCAYCGKTERLHLDHIVAVTKGGTHTADNLQFLCGFHNISKKDKDDASYRRAQGIPLATWWDVNIARAIMLV